MQNIAPTPLDPIQLPLNKPVLIEASAGTGKTFTIANIYLRLLLGVGCTALEVGQILVVTFTNAATEELKDRIRKNVQQCADFLRDQQKGETEFGDKSYRANLAFLTQLYPKIADIHEALLRLSIAEREIDTASVFTIHGFCQKMLVQFALESGVRFDLDLQPNSQELLKRLSESVWRELCYPQNQAVSRVIAQEIGTPENALNSVVKLLSAELPAPNAVLARTPAEQLAHYQQFIDELKADWRANGGGLAEAIRHDLANKISLHGGWYKADAFEKGVLVMENWATSESLELPDEFGLFTAERIAAGTKKTSEPLVNPQLAKNQAFLTAYQQEFEGSLAAVIRYHFLLNLRKKWAEYKQNHPVRTFDDLLTMLNEALKQPDTGRKLAQKIRAAYPFAMIDEFQDTDRTQYEIFRQIFMTENDGNGFIMIGDPKQAIYKFRGADIATYLTAAQAAEAQFTLDKNWRSLPPVVQAVNKLFYFANRERSPFFHSGIGFEPVKADENKGELVGEQAHFNGYLTQHATLDEQAEITAYYIHQQLNAMAAGQFGVEKAGEFTPFAPKDIAILVRKGSQARRIKQALAKRNIKSVYLSESSNVFASMMAKELIWLLQASLNPYDKRALFSALGSTLWGLTANEIHHYQQETWLDAKMNEFVAYSAIWREQGVLPMLHKIYLEQGIIARLNGAENADRHITDLLHLTELLQAQATQLESQAELVHWFEKQVLMAESGEHSRGEEAQKLRLESEEELVKIVTIHSSKGLQYPIVWLPFGAQKTDLTTQPFGVYRQASGELAWCLNGNNLSANAILQDEEKAEDLRLYYVALTRAESQLNLVLPANISGWSPLHYLLAEGELPEATKENKKAAASTADYFHAKAINATFIEVPDEMPVERWEGIEPTVDYHAKTFHGNIRVVGQITSFTSLYAQHERLTEGNPTPVLDWAQDRDQLVESHSAEFNDADEPFSPFQFPHGVKVGTVLHRFFELCPFGAPVAPAQVEKVCEQLNLGEAWFAPTQQWFERILATPFGEPAFCLNDIAADQRLNEWQFYLRLKNDKALTALNRLLKQHSPLAKNLPELQLPQLEGFVRGFVDCIACVNGRFYVLDYKSNFLGYLPHNYSMSHIKQEMGRQRYDLQYLLYTLAVHRYLKNRLRERYDYERDFGGVAYLFLRAMNGENGSGVYFDKPSRALIDELDQLFG